ncbi:MAG: hypothetical protein DMG40_08500 [Acidobacteria bacterium]|nr:MAG: hypothetical protein DMG40_08500 [Acidobacteriota bacterium]
MNPKARLLTEQRRRNLRDLVDQQGQVTVGEMVKSFSISAVTPAWDVLEAQLNNVTIRSAREVNVVTDSENWAAGAFRRSGPSKESGV